MAFVTVRDNALWAKHIEGDPEAVARVMGLPQDAPIVLLIEGTPVRFAKMRDGADGRPTPGLRPADSDARRFWGALQTRRGERVSVMLADDLPDDGHLRSLVPLLSEWESPEDAAAYDRL